MPADFKSSTKATTNLESDNLLRELLSSLKVSVNIVYTNLVNDASLKELLYSAASRSV